MQEYRKETSKRELNWVERFLLFSAAVDLKIVKSCPNTEKTKYIGIGATILFTAILAFLSGGYALYTVFNTVWIAVVLGAFWALIIFNLDRYIVGTLRKHVSGWTLLGQSIPRIVLAVLLAIVIATPLELKIFESEIKEALHTKLIEDKANLEKGYEAKIKRFDTQISALRLATQQSFELREKYYEDYKCECEGSCGTGVKGEGSECLRKERKYKKADQEYLALKTENDAAIAALAEQQQKVLEERKTTLEHFTEAASNGLLAQLNALSRLPWLPKLGIMLLFIAIELAPVLTKLLAPIGPYDYKLQSVEYQYEIEELQLMHQKNQEIQQHLAIEAKKHFEREKLTVSSEQKASDLIENAQQDLLEEQIAIWVQKEKSKMRNEANPNV